MAMVIAMLITGCGTAPEPSLTARQGSLPLPTRQPSQSPTRQTNPSATPVKAITPIPALVNYLAQIAQRWEEGDHDGAMTALDDLIAAEPGFCDALMMRAKLLAEEGNSGAAFADVSQVISLSPGTVDAYLLRAALLESIGESQLALIDLNIALSLAEDNTDALVARGDLLAEMGDVEGAIGDYSAAIALGLTSPAIHLAQGTLLNRVERYEEARERLLSARSGGETGYEVHYQLALASFFTGRFDEGLAYVNMALRDAPDSIEAMSLRGTLHLNIAAWEAASEDFRQVLSISPAAIDAYYGIAQAEAGGGHRENAIEACEAYLALAQPTDRNYTAVTALLAMLNGDWAAAPGQAP